MLFLNTPNSSCLRRRNVNKVKQVSLSQCTSVFSRVDSSLDDNLTVPSSTTASTTTVSCSPRWIVHPGMQGVNGQQIGMKSQKQCLDKCVHDSCVAVDYWFDTKQCYLHNHLHTRRQNNATTQFEIIRQCYPSSST